MISHEKIINPINFSEHCDEIYSRIVPTNYLVNNKSKYKILEEINSEACESTFYINQEMRVFSGMSIFANTETVELLFQDLKKLNGINNLNLVTSQSDRSVTEKLFKKKPDIINNWYSTNVEYQHKKLIALPLGISDAYNKNNFSTDTLIDYKLVDNEKKEELFLNFRVNTNTRHRQALLNKFENKTFTAISNYGSNPIHYMDTLSKYRYVLCPWGNGLDTYRVWETLLAGSIPVVLDHPAYTNFKELPIIFYQDVEELSIDYLRLKSKNFQLKNNIEKLTVNHWLTLDNENVGGNQFFFNSFTKGFTLKRKVKSKIKIFKYYLKRYSNLSNYYRFLKKFI